MGMTGTIEVNNLRLFARHGVDPQERIVGNTFEITVHVQYPITEAMKRDHISTTLNYARLVDVIKEVMRTPSSLLENVAYRIYKAIINEFHLIEGGHIRVAKIAPPIKGELDSVAVSLNW